MTAAADVLGSSSWSDDGDPQQCPVCDHEAMQATGGDDFGYGITAATCLVCSYRRSDRIAYDLGMDLEWETRWKD